MLGRRRRDNARVRSFWIGPYLVHTGAGHGYSVTDRARIRIAAAVTALFLAVLSAAGLAARDHSPQATASQSAQPAATASPVATPDVRIFGEEEGDDDE